MNVRIYTAARIALIDIWHYTNEKWGRRQADQYIRSLYAALNKVSEKRHLWRAVDHEEAQGVFFLRHEHHYIFFREFTKGGIGVIDIAHERTDLPERLKDHL